MLTSRVTLRRAGWLLITALIFNLGMTEVAAAGPQDDVQPPTVDVNATNGWYGQGQPHYGLTLETAGTEGGLEPGQVQAAVSAAAAAAAHQGGSDPSTGGQGVAADEVVVSGGTADGSSGGSGPVALNSTECQWRDANIAAGDPRWSGNNPASGSLMINTCNGPATYLYVPNSAFNGGPGAPAPPPPPPPPPPDPAVLAQQARAALTLPEPEVHRSPPEDNSDPAYGGLPYTWVGLSTYYWVTDWQPLARTVELRGVSATVTATPTGLTFDPGDGNPPVSCDGPGRPWVEADGNDAPSDGACGYTYRSVTPDGPLTATTSVRWSVSWTSSTGAAGTFPASTTSSSSSFLVEQIQVVIR